MRSPCTRNGWKLHTNTTCRMSSHSSMSLNFSRMHSHRMCSLSLLGQKLNGSPSARNSSKTWSFWYRSLYVSTLCWLRRPTSTTRGRSWLRKECQKWWLATRGTSLSTRLLSQTSSPKSVSTYRMRSVSSTKPLRIRHLRINNSNSSSRCSRSIREEALLSRRIRTPNESDKEQNKR